MAVPVPQAADRLGVAPGTLRRWIREGAPVARRGRRGRGNATLVEPQVIEAWRDNGKTGIDPVTLAGELPELIAAAVWQVHQISEGPHAAKVAHALAAAWYTSTNAMLDRLRQDSPEIPELEAMPVKIERLRSF